MRLVLIGPQGSGKGTQAQRLVDIFHIPHISTGDIFRKHIQEQTSLGKKVRALIEKGELVPEELTNTIVAQRLTEEDCKEGFLLDGYPRNIPQAQFLEEHFPIDYLLEIHVSDDESIKRISGRRTCSVCGKVYHLLYNPPPKEDTCSCGGKLIQRSDDTEEAIKKRLALYHQETEPVIQFFKQKGKHLFINGEQPIEKVTKEILEALHYAGTH